MGMIHWLYALLILTQTVFPPSKTCYLNNPGLITKITFYFQEENLWACLAAMATYAKDLNTAEVAYAAIKEVFII